MDMFGNGRPRKTKRSKRHARGDGYGEGDGYGDGSEFGCGYEGGVYAPYEKRVGLKRAKQIGNRRMREMGLTIEERRYEQRDPERHDARKLRYIHTMPKGKIIHRVARVKKGRAKVDTAPLMRWLDFFDLYKKHHGFEHARGQEGVFRGLQKMASNDWKDIKAGYKTIKQVLGQYAKNFKF